MKSTHHRAPSACLTAVCACACVVIAVLFSTGVSARTSKGTLVVFGSSSVNGSFGHLIEDDFTHLGFRVTRHGYSAAGFARPDFRDLPQLLERLPIARDVTSVLLYVGGNDAQSLWLRPHERAVHGTDSEWIRWKDERWSAIYEARATKVINSLCSRGAQHTFVLPPADVINTRLQRRLDRIHALLERAVESSSCGHFVSLAGDRGKFKINGESLRSPDGVHMTRPGALHAWKRARETVLTLILAGPASARN